jgi:hypothetical protein
MTLSKAVRRAFTAASRDQQVRIFAMKAITKFVAGAVAFGAFAAAAPAAAQYYPGYGYPGYGYGGGVVGAIINSVTRPYGGYGTYGGYGYNVPGGSQVAANQCTAAVQQRLSGYGGYGYGAGYGRVLGVTSIELRQNGGYRVRGNAVAGAGYAGGGTIGFTCRTDPRGLVMDVGFNNGAYGYGYGSGYGNGYSGAYYNDPVTAYGYQRY